MAWWRRDPSLCARSPAHLYAQRILKDNEVALRNRSFSRTLRKSAQRQDHDSTGRPDGTTDLEWAQLQRYRRWRKMLQEHPYKGLFGASEDMLRGKGLTNWDWVYKTFPKWMLQEMDPHGPANDSAKICHSGRRFGEKSEALSQAVRQESNERKHSLAQPAIRSTHYELREGGVESPLDLRRPADASHVKAVSRSEKPVSIEAPEIVNNDSISLIPDPGVRNPNMGYHILGQAEPSLATLISDSTATSTKVASRRESSIVDSFFADELSVHDSNLGSSISWRQTALQRRATSSDLTRSKAEPLLVTEKRGLDIPITSSPVPETFAIPSTQASVDNYPYPRLTGSINGTITMGRADLPSKYARWSVPEPTEAVQEAGKGEDESSPVNVTSPKLERLPKDDIDFLSAEEVRAATGRKRSSIRSTEGKTKGRQELERAYANAKLEALDEAVEGNILENHRVRRLQQDSKRARPVHHTAGQEANHSEQPLTEPQPELVQLESSIDRMRKWIEEGGTSLAKHFWQNPIQAGAPTVADMQFAKRMADLGKSRRAREHISEDLTADLPMCKGLLERLKDDENRIEHVISLLQSPRKIPHGSETSKSLQTIRERRLRRAYDRTEKQFEAACQALRGLDNELIQKATNAFKRRLGIASRVLHKNHTLTRMLTWSAQARLDESGLERSKAELYSEILTRLATLRDTQLALARLMDLAVQTYAVSFKPVDELLSRPMPKSDAELAEAKVDTNVVSSANAGAKFLVETAAAARLADEIESQKAAMKGLSDDGYAVTQRYSPRRSFEEKTVLSNSLFRPFSLQLESLSKKVDGGEAEGKLKGASKQEIRDRKLVQEVRDAYEDVHGTITIEHRQVPQMERSVDAVIKRPNVFEVLKDDPVDQTAEVVPEESNRTKMAASNKPLTAEDENKSASYTPVRTSQDATVKLIKPSPTVIGNPTNEYAQSTLAFDQESTTAPDAATIQSTKGSSVINLPTHYTILVHDPQTDILSITTSTSGPPRDTSPALPIHQALSSLKAPAKFIPHISPGLEIITAKRHMLVLRDAIDKTLSIRGFETFSAQHFTETTAASFNSKVNPIDGTTRLSPTGYSGLEQNQEQIERDFEERRQAAVAAEAARSKRSRQQPEDENVLRKRGSIGGVIKAAIWASAVCYIVGVTAEILR